MSTFEGLTDEDFDNYLPPRWSSNLHNLGRMKTKARVKALGEAIAEAIERDGLTVESSSEIPSVWNGREVRDQWAYLLRGAESRKALAPVVAANLDLATRIKDPAEHHRHALMCVHLDHQRLEIGLRINQHATVDLANLLGRADAELGRLEQALAGLPEDITLDGEPVTIPRLKDAARAARAGESEWLVVARSVDRDAAIARGEAIREVVQATAQALDPLFRFALWTPENDHIGAGSKIEAFAEAVEAREHAAEERKAAADAARQTRETEARARTTAKVAADEAWRAMQAEKRRKIAAARAAEETARRAAEQARAAARAAEAAARGDADEAPADAAPLDQAPADTPAADAAATDAAATDAAATDTAPADAAPADAEQPTAPASERLSQKLAGRPARPEGDGEAPAAEARPERARPPQQAPRGPRPDARRGAPSGAAPRRDGPRRGGKPGAAASQRGGKPSGARRPDRPRSDGKPGRSSRPEKDSGPRSAVSKPAPKPAHDFASGEACRLTRGLFAGKDGVIKGPGKAGYYRVKVGPLEVSVSAQEIEPIG